MGVTVNYSAIPPSSTLYARLQREKLFAILMISLFSQGCGIFNFFEEIEPEEVNELLEYVIEEHQDIFGSDLEADQIIAEFRTELRLTRKAYPGIEGRIAFLEKSSNEIMERLTQELARRKVENADEIVVKIMFGDQSFAPILLPESESLGLISRESVREGARILRQIEPETLFAKDEGWEGWCLNHFEHWRDLYLSADERNEEILVGVF
ncbi:MAG: hypothetical protein KME42_28670 [Tildeniella nuda ZEHNDER 1965/U140]|jgi:hypothetical protein|nr:hypothetical protein [Tildeniella nuda ZEHNDER 1965/U140]